MIKEKWNQIIENQDVRQSLSQLRQELKENKNIRELLNLIKGQEELLIGLLRSGDAKIRKNAALLMGDLGVQQFLKPIFDAYEREEQRFVKSSYLAAIGKFDYHGYGDKLRARLELLKAEQVTEENRKHLTEELRALSALLIGIEGVKTHSFTGFSKPYDIILLTNRNFAQLTEDELKALDPGAKTRIFGAGVRAKVTNLEWMGQIRTWQEALFVVKGTPVCPADPFQAAEAIVTPELFRLLDESHEGGAPYYFRVELKSKRTLAEKSAFVKKLSGRIESLSGRKLINTTTGYEFELRLIENKEGSFNLLVKFFTLKDERFSYRKGVIPTSIRPANAALTTALAKEYLKEGAQVLDPFCGVGTMLIERNKAVRAYSSYGLDIQEDAVLKARENTKAAGLTAHYINRDFFQFRHEYLFDEVITDMPFAMGHFTEDEVFELYRRFFAAVPALLKKEAVMVLYSRNKGYVKPLASRNGFTILKEYEISKKEGTDVLILKR